MFNISFWEMDRSEDVEPTFKFIRGKAIYMTSGMIEVLQEEQGEMFLSYHYPVSSVQIITDRRPDLRPVRRNIRETVDLLSMVWGDI